MKAVYTPIQINFKYIIRQPLYKFDELLLIEYFHLPHFKST